MQIKPYQLINVLQFQGDRSIFMKVRTPNLKETER